MRSSHGLLSRIQFASSPNHSHVGARSTDLRDNILAHLQQICATRIGSAPSCPDYGVVAPIEVVGGSPEAVRELVKTLTLTLQKYEPRLTRVKIRHLPSDDLILRFAIEANIVNAGSSGAISFETRVDTTRKVTVK